MKQIIKTCFSAKKSYDLLKSNVSNIHNHSDFTFPYCSITKYLDDGEGRSSYIEISIKCENNKIILELFKKDLPYSFRWLIDDLLDDMHFHINYWINEVCV